ncbi:MAG: type VI secretion system-associated FHA domain protein TagH [Woeseia sp.]
MALQIKVTSDHRELMGDDAERAFEGHGGTIGRGLQSDWILPDEDRYISGRHAALDFKGGAYYIADISTNGVYINDEPDPLGKGNYRRLFNGDRLRMGDFEFSVTIDEGEEVVSQQPEQTKSSDGHMDQVVPEDSLRTGVQLLDEEEITGDGEFQSVLFGTTRMEPAKQANAKGKAKPKRAEAVNPFGVGNRKNQPQGQELLNAFFQGAGVQPDDIHPSLDPREVMLNAGQLLRQFVHGTTELLAGRANVKCMFRLDQTTVLPRHNNPLKLAENAQDSMKQLLVGKKGEYLGPVDSVKEVCRDLKFHQDAMLEAMMSAFTEFSARFDPDELQETFDRNSKSKPLIGALAKLKYWDLYRELYPIATQTGSGPFPQHMAEEFVRAYEKHVAEYKRMDRADHLANNRGDVNAAATTPTKILNAEEASKQRAAAAK